LHSCDNCCNENNLEEEIPTNKKDTKKFFFANWIDIVYLFDIRLLESNLFLSAYANPHGTD